MERFEIGSDSTFVQSSAELPRDSSAATSAGVNFRNDVISLRSFECKYSDLRLNSKLRFPQRGARFLRGRFRFGSRCARLAPGRCGRVSRLRTPGNSGRSGRGVDVVPRAAEQDGGQPLGEVEAAVVERRNDDPLRRAVAPAAVFDEQFRRAFVGRRLLFAGLPDRFAQQFRKSEKLQRRGAEQLRHAVLHGPAAAFEQGEGFAVGRVAGNLRGENSRPSVVP